jgi:hypothetical protein
MQANIEADASGNLLLPLQTAPGALFTVEREGEGYLVRPGNGPASRWAATTAAERLAWIESFLDSLPDGTGLTAEAVTREHLY